jgi:CIC family chloride channel protein
MAAGMGAGIGAIFRAPLAGTIFAAEVMYLSPEFEPEVIIPTGIASVISYCVFGAYAGWQPLFTIPNLTFTNPWQLFPYLLLALFMAALACLYTRTFYACQRAFKRLPCPPHFRPAIGALLTGLIAVGLYLFADKALAGSAQQVLAVLSFGYSSLQNAMTQDTGAAALALLLIALGKIATTGLTIGSGGSGGVFGPSMVIGGCGGGALGIALHDLWPSLAPHPASFVIVGMAGFFAAAAKTPFSTLIIVSEMTGGYSLLLPSLWVCTLAFILSDRQSIYSSQVESRSRSPAHQGAFIRQTLAETRVSECLGTAPPPVMLRDNDPLPAVLDRFNEVAAPVLPVVDGDGRLLGIIDIEEIQPASHEPALQPLVVAADLMRGVQPLVPDDALDRALELFIDNDLPALPVVDDPTRRRLVGMTRRFEIASAYLRHLQAKKH